MEGHTTAKIPKSLVKINVPRLRLCLYGAKQPRGPSAPLNVLPAHHRSAFRPVAVVVRGPYCMECGGRGMECASRPRAANIGWCISGSTSVSRQAAQLPSKHGRRRQSNASPHPLYVCPNPKRNTGWGYAIEPNLSILFVK